MAKGKKGEAEKLVIVQAAVPVVIWRANKALTEEQHEEVARKLQVEQERSGLKIMLVPNSVDVEMGAVLEEQTTTPTPDEAQQQTQTTEEVQQEDGAANDEPTQASEAPQTEQP